MNKAIKILLVLFVFAFSSCRIAFCIAASHTERVVVKTQKIDKYKLTLVSKLDWAGPWYYGYEVRKKHLGIYGFKKYYWCNRDSVKNCIVRVKDDKLIFDKCTNKLIKD